MPKNHRWTNAQDRAIDKIRASWPELSVRKGNNSLLIVTTSLKALVSVLRYFAADEDLAAVLHPYAPGAGGEGRRWRYEIIEVAPFEFRPQVCIPPEHVIALAAFIEQHA